MADNNKNKKIAVVLENVDAIRARKIARAIAAVVEASTVDPYEVSVEGFKMTGVGAKLKQKSIEVS